MDRLFNHQRKKLEPPGLTQRLFPVSSRGGENIQSPARRGTRPKVTWTSWSSSLPSWPSSWRPFSSWRSSWLPSSSQRVSSWPQSLLHKKVLVTHRLTHHFKLTADITQLKPATAIRGSSGNSHLTSQSNQLPSSTRLQFEMCENRCHLFVTVRNCWNCATRFCKKFIVMQKNLAQSRARN
jgi:hypothetical protein